MKPQESKQTMIKTADVYYPIYNDKEHFVILITGGRGCETPTQEVIMADLSVKQIKDIKIGDYVMGDDFHPRKVINTMRGSGMMYKVHQTSGEDYFVNESHILSVCKSRTAMADKGSITKNGTYRRPNGRYPQYSEYTDINVLDYAKSSKHFRENFRGYKAGSIPYVEKSVEIEPYLLGVWLGDGTSIYPQITTPEPEIKSYLQDYAAKNGLQVTINGIKGTAETLRLTKTGKNPNFFFNKLRKHNLIGNKHIPQDYISNSERVRLELLAGLLDTDGSMSANGYEITQKNKQFAKQIKFIADTLGFRTSINTKRGYCSSKDCGNYYRIHINGDVWRIPCKVKRKIVTEDMCHKNKDWRLSELSITKNGMGEWCGISLDGNQRYLHSDGTVTHNSGKSFSASTFIERLTFELGKDESGDRVNHQILFCRYTMVSAAVSVIPEFMEKIDLDGTSKYFHTSRTDVSNRSTGARIMFRGIKTSSGNQTAKLKSIHGLTTFVCDEAEEWTDETDFERIMLSIRQKGIQNRIIIIMNPTDSNHFIYQKYIKNTHKIVEYDGVPVQISTHPNVLHIHTSYLDNLSHLSEEFLKEIRTMKETNPERYAHVVMGQWADVAEGAVFKKWTLCKEFPSFAKKVAIGLDFGYTCFKGDTIVKTLRGDIPIKDIEEGDFVLTRKGYRRVKNRLYNGKKTITTKNIKVGGQKVKIAATEEHNFNANGKWKKYGKLTIGDRLCVLLPLMASNTNATQTGNTQTTTTTSTRSTESTNKNCCIGRFMSSIKGKFPKVNLFTILTKTRSTMIYPILCWLRQENTACCTPKKSNILSVVQTIITGLLRRIGTNAARLLWKDLTTAQENVNTVGQSLFQQTPISVSVQNNATTNGNTQPEKTIFRWFATIVRKLFWATNILNQKRVAMNAHICSLGIQSVETIKTEVCDVYDLEIEGVHEYFANGILVHNCDPSAAVRCGIVDNNLYIDELFYQAGMLASDLARELNKWHGTFVYSDSADPRLIDELMLKGVLIYPVQKGGGSILAGIQRIHDFDNIFVTEHSYNVQNELRNYVWAKDKNGNYINQPEDSYNHCFVGDTLVMTENGEKRIENLKVGEKVLTSNGYKRITKFFDNGIRETIKVRLRFKNKELEIEATPDHKFKTKEEWIELKKLKAGAEMYLCKSLMVKNIGFTEASDTIQEEQNECTLQYGNTTMGKYPKDFTFITKMKTLLITTFPILKYLKVANIYQNTPKNTWKMPIISKKREKICVRRMNMRNCGTLPKKVENGIANTERKSLPICNLLQKFAIGVARSIKPNRMDIIGFVPIIAKQDTDTIIASTMKNVNAQSAERPLLQTDTHPKNIAKIVKKSLCQNLQSIGQKNEIKQVSLESVEIISRQTNHVYDIEVEEAHEFFANGVLVHNCIDAIRYYVLAAILGKVVIKENRKSNKIDWL